MFVILFIQCISASKEGEEAFLVDESYLQLYKELRHGYILPESKRKCSDYFRCQSTPPDFRPASMNPIEKTNELRPKKQRRKRRQKSKTEDKHKKEIDDKKDSPPETPKQLSEKDPAHKDPNRNSWYYHGVEIQDPPDNEGAPSDQTGKMLDPKDPTDNKSIRKDQTEKKPISEASFSRKEESNRNEASRHMKENLEILYKDKFEISFDGFDVSKASFEDILKFATAKFAEANGVSEDVAVMLMKLHQDSWKNKLACMKVLAKKENIDGAKAYEYLKHSHWDILKAHKFFARNFFQYWFEIVYPDIGQVDAMKYEDLLWILHVKLKEKYGLTEKVAFEIEKYARTDWKEKLEKLKAIFKKYENQIGQDDIWDILVMSKWNEAEAESNIGEKLKKITPMRQSLVCCPYRRKN